MEQFIYSLFHRYAFIWIKSKIMKTKEQDIFSFQNVLINLNNILDLFKYKIFSIEI